MAAHDCAVAHALWVFARRGIAEVVRRLQQAGEGMWPRMAQHDWAGRDADHLSPLTFPQWAETAAS